MKVKMAMKKMMMAVSKEKSNMTESDGRGRKKHRESVGAPTDFMV
jgi:hypothetical protein